MMTEAELVNRWQAVCQQIEGAKTSASQQKVCLLAVSKTKPADMVITLLKAGQKHFGENYLQEAVDKIAAVEEWRQASFDEEIKEGNKVKSIPVVWHYIGHIQRNKTRDIAKSFDWVHTIERDIIAKRLNDQRPDGLNKLNVLIQVNIDNEESKSGCQPSKVNELVEKIKIYQNLSLRGIMIIPSKQSENAFGRTKRLFDEIATLHPELADWDTLSMGMSADIEEAVAKGSTMVRVGSAIFGERK